MEANTIKFGIVFVTYNKRNTIFPVAKRAIESILAQTYTDWKIYLIGDKYEPDSEFQELAKLIPPDKSHVQNLEKAAEREKMTGQNLWHNGGITGNNTGLDAQRKDGIEVTTHLDHDDIWRPWHLETLANYYKEFPEAVFIYTQANYLGTPLPGYMKEIHYNNKMPTPCQMAHSSASWRLDKIKHNYEWSAYPGDANMWARISGFCSGNGLKTLYVPIQTVDKLSEGL